MKAFGPMVGALAAISLVACAERAEEVEATPAVAAATPAVGATGADTACSKYGLIDRSNNGLFERAEYDAFGDGVFADWDMDDDNRLSRAEYDRCWNAGGWSTSPANYNPGVSWTAWDDNTDGFLDENEFFGDDEFIEWDDDRSGALEMGEWS